MQIRSCFTLSVAICVSRCSGKGIPDCFFGQNVLITSSNNYNLKDDQTANVKLDINTAAWEQWTMTDAGSNKVFIKSSRNQNLQDNQQGSLLLSGNSRDWEKWTIMDSGFGDGTIYLRGSSGQYLQVNGTAVSLASQSTLGAFQQWKIRQATPASNLSVVSCDYIQPVTVTATVTYTLLATTQNIWRDSSSGSSGDSSKSWNVELMSLNRGALASDSSGSYASSGSNQSGSGGFYLPVWQWCVVITLLCACCSALAGACMSKPKSKQTKRRPGPVDKVAKVKAAAPPADPPVSTSIDPLLPLGGLQASSYPALSYPFGPIPTMSTSIPVYSAVNTERVANPGLVMMETPMAPAFVPTYPGVAQYNPASVPFAVATPAPPPNPASAPFAVPPPAPL